MENKYECPLCKKQEWFSEKIEFIAKLKVENTLFIPKIKYSKLQNTSLVTCYNCGYMFMVRGKECK